MVDIKELTYRGFQASVVLGIGSVLLFILSYLSVPDITGTCGHCGHELQSPEGVARECPECGKMT